VPPLGLPPLDVPPRGLPPLDVPPLASFAGGLPPLPEPLQAASASTRESGALLIGEQSRIWRGKQGPWPRSSE
jgi:hypothetical protein